MKTWFALSLALVFTIPSQAGAWDLFPLGQRSYLADSLQTPVSVEMYLVDSLLPGGQEDVSYFNMQSRMQVLGNCFSTFSDPYEYLNYLDPNSFKDSLISRNDTVFYNSGYSSLPFYFLPLASVGQSWTVTSNFSGNSYNQITITCASLEQRTFLGFTDSVKVFSLAANGSSPGQTPISNFQMVLSKSHGFVELVPFDLFLFHPSYVDFRSLKIVGLDDGTTSVGFRSPGFSDFFHLHTGDVLVWEFHERSADISYPETYSYEIDTITNSIITADSVVYYAHKTTYSPAGVVGSSTGLLFRYIRSDYDKLFNAGTNAMGLKGWYDGLGFTGSYETAIHPPTLDPIVSWTIAYPGIYLDTLNCEVQQVADIDYSCTLDTRVGYKYFNYGDMQSFSVHTKTLIGSVINGVPDGDFTLEVRNADQPELAAVVVYPNPVQEFLHASLPTSSGPWQYEVLDALGRTVKSGMLRGGGMDVADLMEGSYLLRLRSGEWTSTARFVKE